MNRNKMILIALLVIAITSLAAAIPADELRNATHISPAASTRTATAGLPDDLSPGFTFSKNFYDVYGTPNLIASIVGDEKFDRGDEVTLTIDLINRGVVLGFESDRMPDDDEEIDLARMELGYELQQVNAIGITAILAAPEDSPIEVKSGPQQAGSINGDEGARKTVRFNIEIDENAPAGTYPLILATSYMYQKNAQVSGNVSDNRADVNLWYDTLNQTQVLYITVEKLADFEVTNVSSDLRAGEDDRVLSITYLNTGEETATDAVARISVTDPFSSTDDQAYLGTLAPGESVTGTFVLDTDSGAAIKSYGIDTEIRFTDSTGESKISESMTAAVTIAPLIPTSEKVKPYILPAVLLVLLVLVAAGVRYYLTNFAGNRNTPRTDGQDD
uniref:CARDB domain-containing protein n=2 Tax=Candidatus Methanogaster sp. ANME-2c ERB4 TaxID=2759911 RepID=A0A7G9Y9D6_9EURY|nr:hypothetical protein ADKHHHMD_00001 [Methanosarcinales archaeon ANME-2c ERB4]QNO49698.1 hypothetical protein ADAIOCCD_00006 [Methanosarcinales archaeon ANME-2c ERB4]